MVDGIENHKCREDGGGTEDVEMGTHVFFLFVTYTTRSIIYFNMYLRICFC